MAEVDPDQLAALRRLRAVFGVEVMEVTVHRADQDPAGDGQAPGRGSSGRR